MPVQFDSLADGCAGFDDLLDSALAGRPTIVHRGNHTIAFVDADRWALALRHLLPTQVQIEPDGDGWCFYLDGVSISAYGDDFEDVLDNAIAALRDYADAWEEQLKSATNHADNWDLVHMIALSTDGDLKAWLTRGTSQEP